MFRRDLQVAANVVCDQFLYVLRVLYRQVVTQAGGNQDLLDAGAGARLARQRRQRRVIGIEVFADAGVHAAWLATGRLDLATLAGDAIHVGGRSAKVGNHAGKARHLVTNVFHFAQDRFFRTALDNAAFVFGDRTERTATETATHDVHRKADHLVGGNLALAGGRVQIGRASCRGRE